MLGLPKSGIAVAAVVCLTLGLVPLLGASHAPLALACSIQDDWKHHIPWAPDSHIHAIHGAVPSDNSEDPEYWQMEQSSIWQITGEGSSHSEFVDGYARNHHDTPCEIS